MNIQKAVIICLLAAMPCVSYGQSTDKKHRKVTTSTIPNQKPKWAKAGGYDGKSHVYFADYYTFYDANRGGYMFWENDKWSFTPTMPPYMEKLDMSRDRVQILKGLNLELHPELEYPRYMKLYPAVNEYNDVPVPHAASMSDGQ